MLVPSSLVALVTLRCTREQRQQEVVRICFCLRVMRYGDVKRLFGVKAHNNEDATRYQMLLLFQPC